MSMDELDRAEREDPQLAVAHLLRNDLSVLRGLLEDQRRGLERALHRVQGTMDGLQGLLDVARAGSRQDPRLIDPAGTYTIRRDPAGDGRFGAPRRNSAGAYEHRGLDTRTTPGDTARAPIAGTLVRTGVCYADDPTYRLVVIVAGTWQCKVLYVLPLDALVGCEVRLGQIVGLAQDVTERKDYRAQGMRPHLHTEVWHGRHLDPAPLMGIT